jgi:hypothetical protein
MKVETCIVSVKNGPFGTPVLWPGPQDRQLASYLQMNFLHPGDAEVLGCFGVWASPARHARELGPQPADDYPSLLDEIYHDHVPC